MLEAVAPQKPAIWVRYSEGLNHTPKPNLQTLKLNLTLLTLSLTLIFGIAYLRNSGTVPSQQCVTAHGGPKL